MFYIEIYRTFFIMYARSINKFEAPFKTGEFYFTMPKNSKFLTNDNNILYFEYSWDEGDSDGNISDTDLEQYRFYIMKYEQFNKIKPGYSFVCTYKQNDEIFFLFTYDIGWKFMDMFGGGLI